MKKIGLKNALLISIMLLVAGSVSISNLLSYLNEKKALTNTIMHESMVYVEGKAKIIETQLNEKVGGIGQLAQFYNDHPLGTLSDEEAVNQTKFMASAMNLGSSVLAFENGDGYWNQTADSWPNHKYAGNVTERPWYQAARSAPGVTVTEPYQGTDGVYWVSIVSKINGGVISVDMKLEFLNQIVSEATDIKGSVALILNQDTTLLASSSPAVETGRKASDFDWFKEASQYAVREEYGSIDYELDGKNKILFSHRIKVGDKNWYFAIGVDKSIAFAPLASARNSAIITSTVATIVSVIISFFVIQLLYRPIISLRNTVQNLSSGDGDLTQRLKVHTNDDIGKISEGVNTFIASLQSMMIEIRDVGESLQSNVVLMRRQSEENSAILQHHVTETEQIVTAVEEMDATANSMATHAANTANLTQEANRTSDDSRHIVQRSQQTVSSLIDDVDKASADVQKMNTQTENISSILSVIGDIAEQTNLLALNAAIEAARAGDQGRGFAVVADEVRKLASLTKESTDKIEDALKSLLGDCQLVVDSMEYTKGRCQETASGSQEVGDSLEILMKFVDEINDLSSQIATAAEEQSSVTQEVSRNMTAISDIVTKLDENGNKALEDAANIEAIDERLMSIVGRFKL